MFVVVALVIVLCLGVTVYTGATGNSNPVATGLGVVIKPIQKRYKPNRKYDFQR